MGMNRRPVIRMGTDPTIQTRCGFHYSLTRSWDDSLPLSEEQHLHYQSFFVLLGTLASLPRNLGVNRGPWWTSRYITIKIIMSHHTMVKTTPNRFPKIDGQHLFQQAKTLTKKRDDNPA
ncbi:hypothetical protein PIB30_013353 [Stylosanthes scabra]|uniref:Uncharacterized protein n=1 Tax=Stylosanthes scabra TaxID=79078 RepID=A0ABU6U5D1_9FABA|nr:hypothetical protein [Stylosanthes scabra]